MVGAEKGAKVGSAFGHGEDSAGNLKRTLNLSFVGSLNV